MWGGVEQRDRSQRVGTLSSADVVPALGLQTKGKVGIRLSREHTSLGPMQPERGFSGKRRGQTTPLGACLSPEEGLKFGANMGERQCRGICWKCQLMVISINSTTTGIPNLG